MSREVRRVPLDFSAPIGEIWAGYVMPEDLYLPKCPDCDGRGWSPEYMHLHSLWYGYVPFKPEDNGSTPFTADTPAVYAFAERNVTRAHHVNADDIAALIAADRLYDFTCIWPKEDGWQPIVPTPVPTPEQVNEWNILTMGHDGINAHAVIRARAERDGVPLCCHTCDGSGNVATPEQKAAHDAWERTDPPEGEGWQLWSTAGDGKPISPVCINPDELAYWMVTAGEASTVDVARRFIDVGWCPSGGSINGGEMLTGVELIGRMEGAS